MQPFYNRSCTRTFELARAPPFPRSACVPASSFSTYLLRELLHCHRSFQTRHCPVTRRCPRGAGRAPDPACRSAHAPFGRAARRTHRAQRPALRHNHGRAGPSPDAPLRGRLRAPKAGLPTRTGSSLSFSPVTRRPIYLLFRRPHCCHMTINI